MIDDDSPPAVLASPDVQARLSPRNIAELISAAKDRERAMFEIQKMRIELDRERDRREVRPLMAVIALVAIAVVGAVWRNDVGLIRDLVLPFASGLVGFLFGSATARRRALDRPAEPDHRLLPPPTKA